MTEHLVSKRLREHIDTSISTNAGTGTTGDGIERVEGIWSIIPRKLLKNDLLRLTIGITYDHLAGNNLTLRLRFGGLGGTILMEHVGIGESTTGPGGEGLVKAWISVRQPGVSGLLVCYSVSYALYQFAHASAPFFEEDWRGDRTLESVDLSSDQPTDLVFTKQNFMITEPYQTQFIALEHLRPQKIRFNNRTVLL